MGKQAPNLPNRGWRTLPRNVWAGPQPHLRSPSLVQILTNDPEYATIPAVIIYPGNSSRGVEGPAQRSPGNQLEVRCLNR
jgi:hypothetical protein